MDATAGGKHFESGKITKPMKTRSYIPLNAEQW